MPQTPDRSTQQIRQMIDRKPDAAEQQAFDVIVVGGGIYGVCLALEATRLGLRALLLEQADFGSTTTWNTGRIIHGGIRYLQRLDFLQSRKMARERRWFLRSFPDLVRPTPFVMPLYGLRLKRPSIFRAGSVVNDLIAFDRNRDVPNDRKLPRGGVLTPSEAVDMFPFIQRAGLAGAGVWHDAMLASPQRLIIEMLHWASDLGAVALNYVKASQLVVKSGKVLGIEAVDQVTQNELQFRGSTVFNCTGPFATKLAARFDQNSPGPRNQVRLTKVLVSRSSLSQAALAVETPAPDAHVYFMCPCLNGTIVGGLHSPLGGGGFSAAEERSTVLKLLEAINTALPNLDLAPSEVLRVWSGVQPADGSSSTRLAKRASVYEHARHGGPDGLISVIGPKFSSARRVAESALRNTGNGRWRKLSYRPNSDRPQTRKAPLNLHDRKAFLNTTDAVAASAIKKLISEESVVQADDLLLRRTDWLCDATATNEVTARMHRLMHDEPNLYQKQAPNGDA